MKMKIRMAMTTFLFLALFFFLQYSTAAAEIFCVANSAELQSALTAAQSNGYDDTIKIVEGSYIGNFVYNSSEPSSLTIEGGYSTDCSSRTGFPGNTVLDANGTGTVLKITALLDAIVDGITLQNGSNSGLIASLGRDFLLSNCKIQNNAGGNGGGAGISAKKIDVLNNTIIYNVAV